MFTSIVCPVDLAHKTQLAKGVAIAADLAKHYKASLTLIGVSMSAPTAVAHNPKEYAVHLAAFAEKVGKENDLNVGSEAVFSHDPAIDLEDQITAAAKTLAADLIVMSSHKPGLLDHIFTSHAGSVSTHTDLSVFIVR